jgi:DNA-binding MarR family transcriptional regulator
MAKRRAEDRVSPTALHHLTFILQHQYDDHLMSRVGVGFAQTRIMEALHDTIPRSQRYVADRLGQTEANVSRQLRQLNNRRLVSIIKNKQDARARDITLTKEGAKRLHEAQKLLQNQYDDLIEFLNERDQKSFNRIVDNLLKAIKPPISKE